MYVTIRVMWVWSSRERGRVFNSILILPADISWKRDLVSRKTQRVRTGMPVVDRRRAHNRPCCLKTVVYVYVCVCVCKYMYNMSVHGRNLRRRSEANRVFSFDTLGHPGGTGLISPIIVILFGYNPPGDRVNDRNKVFLFFMFYPVPIYTYICE